MYCSDVFTAFDFILPAVLTHGAPFTSLDSDISESATSVIVKTKHINNDIIYIISVKKQYCDSNRKLIFQRLQFTNTISS